MPAGPAATVGPILAVTVRVEHSGDVAAAWRRTFDWDDLGQERVGARQALAWDAPAAAGRRWWAVGPPAGAAGVLRFVEGPPDAGAGPLQSTGWAAVELLVADADAVARRLVGAPFRILGPPRPLGGDARLGIRALQAVGPGGEVVYLTEIGPSADARLPRARCAVDRPFVAVLGATDAAVSAAHHAATLGLSAPAPPQEWAIDVLNDAFGLDRATRHPLATLPLAGGCLLEVDGYPAAAARRPDDDDLPPGIAVVTLATAGAPRTYRGPDGEVVELVARRSSASARSRRTPASRAG